ncbi:VCBS repeat-containing protein, partial [bacterium]
MRKILPLCTALLLFVLLLRPRAGQAADGGGKLYLPLISRASPAPTAVLKWAYGGCYSSWCETGWYSSPATLDLDADGIDEIVASAYSLWALDGPTGALLWRAGDTSRRTWLGVVVADLDLDGQSEIVIAQDDAYVSAYRPDGNLKWQKQPSGTAGEFRGLLVADLDGNGGPLEVIVTRAYGSARNTWVLDANGNTRSGWPQLPNEENTSGYAWGVYSANAAAADISGDARLELIVPSDMHYINAFEPDGSPLPASTGEYPGKTWGQVGVWE